MTRKKSDKQLAGLALARGSRHNTAKKENLLPTLSSPPRTKTRAQTNLSALNDRIDAQKVEISSLRAENTQISRKNSHLTTKLDQSAAAISALEEEKVVMVEELEAVKMDLDEANTVISDQQRVIQQKTQRINRLMRDKANLSAKLGAAQQQLVAAVLRAEKAEKLTVSDSLRIESLLRTVSHLNNSISHHEQKNKELYGTLRATRKQVQRAKASLQIVRKEVSRKSKWVGKTHRTYNSQYRSLALAFHKAGCAQHRIGSLLVRVGNVLGVKVSHAMSRRTISRVIKEAGIKVRLQLGHEIALAKNLVLSSDGTSVRNIQVEARHITLQVPTYTTDPAAPQESFRTRVVGLENALDHTAQTQFQGWEEANRKIFETYSNSPLAKRDALNGINLELDDMWRKMVAYNADHASDVRLAAKKCIEKKRSVLERDAGENVIQNMSDEELKDALWDVVQEMCDDPDGLDPTSLDDKLRTEALQALARHLGSQTIESLSQREQDLLLRVVIAGCCDHKDHNCTKAGVAGMNAAWEELGLTPPVLLANKDNAATIALGTEADSDAVERAIKASQNGGYKLVSICGNLFRHKDDKRGHQDFHRHYFEQVKFDVTGEHSTVKFPDTSNIRFGSHCAGAAELVKFHSAYLDFLAIIRDSKQTAGLNHSEQNALNGLNDMATMTECCVMTLYKNAVSDPYIAATRKPGVNHADLGPLHEQVIAHIQKLHDNPDLLLDPTSHTGDATLDGLPYRDQFAVDSVHFMAERNNLPHLEVILKAFLKATIPAWQRFSEEWQPGSILDSLSPAEKLLMFIPANNDANEGLLGGWRVWSRRSGITIENYSFETAYHHNDTEAFANAMLTEEEDQLYIMRLARIEDASGAAKKFREELLAFKQRVANEARLKQQAKQDKAADRNATLKAVTVITDAEVLGNLKRDLLRQQLDIRREILKEDVISKTLLKDMKSKPAMLQAILASDARRLAV